MSITIIIPIFFGIAIGFVVNYLADVLPVTRRLAVPVCVECAAPFDWTSYLSMRPCPNGHKRSFRTWLVLLMSVVISIPTFVFPQSNLSILPGFLVIGYFGTVFVIDMEHRLILHPTSLFGVVLGLVVGVLTNGLIPTLLGGLGGFVIMVVFYLFGILVAKIRARRMLSQGQDADEEEALGAGDVILAAILGFMLGWPLIWFGLLLGILLGGLFSLVLVIWLLASGKYGKNVLNVFIPYGPYFLTSAYLIIFFPKLVQLIVPD